MVNWSFMVELVFHGEKINGSNRRLIHVAADANGGINVRIFEVALQLPAEHVRAVYATIATRVTNRGVPLD